MSEPRSRIGTWAAYPSVKEPKPEPEQERGLVSDFLLFALLPMAQLQLQGLPVSELAIGLVAVIGLARPTRARFPMWWLLLPLLFGLMAFSAEQNHITPVRRLLHIGLYVLLALLCAQGRFHVRSMARGLAAGLLISAGAYFLGYGTAYAGRLAGLMADPNAAGYLLVVLGCLAMAQLADSRFRVAIALSVTVAVVLTFSRTSLLALALVAVWVVVGRRFSAGFGAILLALMVYAVSNIPISLRTFGPFADRSGSDALRNRIVAQEQLQIAGAPWYGNGPGTSHVLVQEQPFFYHNSYLALLNEGGRLAQVLLLGAGFFALVKLLRMPLALRNYWYEGALIAVAVCAVNLGEVLLELPAALALGLAAYHRSTAAAAAAASAPDAFPAAETGASP